MSNVTVLFGHVWQKKKTQKKKHKWWPPHTAELVVVDVWFTGSERLNRVLNVKWSKARSQRETSSVGVGNQ